MSDLDKNNFEDLISQTIGLQSELERLGSDTAHFLASLAISGATPEEKQNIDELSDAVNVVGKMSGKICLAIEKAEIPDIAPRLPLSDPEVGGIFIRYVRRYTRGPAFTVNDLGQHLEKLGYDVSPQAGLGERLAELEADMVENRIPEGIKPQWLRQLYNGKLYRTLWVAPSELGTNQQKTLKLQPQPDAGSQITQDFRSKAVTNKNITVVPNLEAVRSLPPTQNEVTDNVSVLFSNEQRRIRTSEAIKTLVEKHGYTLTRARKAIGSLRSQGQLHKAPEAGISYVSLDPPVKKPSAPAITAEQQIVYDGLSREEIDTAKAILDYFSITAANSLGKLTPTKLKAVMIASGNLPRDTDISSDQIKDIGKIMCNMGILTRGQTSQQNKGPARKRTTWKLGLSSKEVKTAWLNTEERANIVNKFTSIDDRLKILPIIFI